MTTLDRVAAEIGRLHQGFERWFGGDEGFDFTEFERALADDFTFYPPDGASVDRADLLEGLRSAFGSRSVRIRIERPVILWERDGAILAGYEEWHDHDDHSIGRRSSVLLTRDEGSSGGLLWRHVQETWLKRPPPR